jgi:hypothetical protein
LKQHRETRRTANTANSRRLTDDPSSTFLCECRSARYQEKRSAYTEVLTICPVLFVHLLLVLSSTVSILFQVSGGMMEMLTDVKLYILTPCLLLQSECSYTIIKLLLAINVCAASRGGYQAFVDGQTCSSQRLKKEKDNSLTIGIYCNSAFTLNLRNR